MLIYLEKRAEEYEIAQSILKKFPDAEVLRIDHYKNIFDKRIGNRELIPALIIAKDEHPNILDVPRDYGYPGKSFFFRSSLNCVFDCEYCYLKGNFKTKYPVIFVNYDDIKKSIKEKIEQLRDGGYQGQITFYASNYSDIQGLDSISGFNQAFIPFIEQFDNVLMETRTKSANVDSLLSVNDGIPFKNTEVSFSLNPEDIIEKFEKKTAPLKTRIQAINTLLNKGYKVGLRFLPLLPVEGYERLYKEFLEQIKQKIPLDKIYSIFIASLIYNPGDYKIMQKKNEKSELWNMVTLHENGLVKLPDEVFNTFVKIFKEAFPNNEIYFDFI